MPRRATDSRSKLWVDPVTAVILTGLLLVGFVAAVGVALWMQLAVGL